MNKKDHNRNKMNLPHLAQNQNSLFPQEELKILNIPDEKAARRIKENLIKGPYSSRVEYDQRRSQDKRSLRKSGSRSKILVATVNKSHAHFPDKKSLGRRSVSNHRSTSRNTNKLRTDRKESYSNAVMRVPRRKSKRSSSKISFC